MFSRYPCKKKEETEPKSKAFSPNGRSRGSHVGYHGYESAAMDSDVGEGRPSEGSSLAERNSFFPWKSVL